MTLLGILLFGLNPKGFHLSNNVKWIGNQNGIRFAKYGITYTNSFFISSNNYSHISSNWSIETALRVNDINGHGDKFLLVIHNKEYSKQLVIRQWRSDIYITNEDEYSGSLVKKRIALGESLLSQRVQFLTITSGEQGTEIYLDGQLTKVNKDLVLEIPNGRTKTQLVVGNSVDGRHSWTGDIYGLALYGYALSAKDVELHFKQWSEERNFTFAKEDAPKVLYIFDEKGGEKAFDQSGEKHDLQIPWRMQILKKEILAAPWREFKLNGSFVQDITLNIAGFIPFGFFLNAMFVNIGGFVKKHSFLATVFLCFVISLLIEIAQAWMPTRSSQMLDVMSNTLGASLGVLLYRFIYRLSPKGTVT